jgi:hypothetical protein
MDQQKLQGRSPKLGPHTINQHTTAYISCKFVETAENIKMLHTIVETQKKIVHDSILMAATRKLQSDNLSSRMQKILLQLL